ncbi:MAG TPA: hypothetical protein VGD45_20405 [Steroidobacter sp.]|uniref:hypothetical protein n=1 Tax=Steroidobacter sp. TaxID=1978227 RepID=UPI002EDAEDC6
MHADDIDALWDFLTSDRTQSLVDQLRADPRDEAMAVLGISEVGPLSPENNGTRYFTVQFESLGRVHYRHLEAQDHTHAGNRVLWREPSAISAEVVREISREEFERLTRVPL